MIQYLKGNLITLAKDGHFDVIIHGCNCQSIMGSGIAAQIAFEFPHAKAVDYYSPLTPVQKLGNFTYADHNGLIVVNCYSQFAPATFQQQLKKVCVLDYDALYSSLSKVTEQFSGSRFGIPLIGAGLANGDWVLIESIIAEVFINENITIVQFD
jgi:hypothetical protein